MSEEINRMDTLNLMKEVISDKETRDFLLDICEFGKSVKMDGSEESDKPKIFLLCDVQIDNHNAICPDKPHPHDDGCKKNKEKCHKECEKPCNENNPHCGGQKSLLESIRCSELNTSNIQRFLLSSIIIHDLLRCTSVFIAKPTKEDLYPLMSSKDNNLIIIAL